MQFVPVISSPIPQLYRNSYTLNFTRCAGGQGGGGTGGVVEPSETMTRKLQPEDDDPWATGI